VLAEVRREFDFWPGPFGDGQIWRAYRCAAWRVTARLGAGPAMVSRTGRSMCPGRVERTNRRGSGGCRVAAAVRLRTPVATACIPPITTFTTASPTAPAAAHRRSSSQRERRAGDNLPEPHRTGLRISANGKSIWMC